MLNRYELVTLASRLNDLRRPADPFWGRLLGLRRSPAINRNISSLSRTMK